MKRSLFALAIACAALVAVAGSQAAGRDSSGHSPYTAGRYIVTFADDPAASYDGYESGFPATRPHPGRKLNPDSPAVQNWQQHLVAKHDAALATVGASKIYDYTIASNGIAADLTAAQAAVLAKLPGVLGLAKDRLEHPETTLSPHFLGLDAPGGVWSQLGGARNAGAGIVVGVRDARVAGERRLRLRSRRRRARVAHLIDGGRQQRHDGHYRREPDRQGLGHGPGREARDVQGVLGGPQGRSARLLRLRQRGRDQRRRRRRGRRPQTTAGSFIPRSSAPRNRRPGPPGAAHPRTEDDRPG